jgi:hypothetical protein
MKMGGTTWSVTLTNGNYNGTAFAAHVQSRIQTVTSELVTVTYSAVTDKLTITAPNAMSILFDVNNSAHTLMGFGTTTYSLPMATAVPGPNIVNLDGDPYVLLKILGYSTISCKEISGDVFAKIKFNSDDHPFVANTFVFVTPKMIERLHIQFVRPNGELYDFNGKEHSFSIEAMSDF